MALNLGRLKLFMGPKQLDAPATCLIQQSILLRHHIKLESRPIADALISARQRGVSVRVVLEENYLSVQRPLADPWSEGGNNETNRQIYDALQRAKIEVKKEYPTPSLFKLMIFRMSRSTAKLMLNENYRDYTYYREHGWFESNYYYPVKLNPFKKLIGRFFDILATQMAKSD